MEPSWVSEGLGASSVSVRATAERLGADEYEWFTVHALLIPKESLLIAHCFLVTVPPSAMLNALTLLGTFPANLAQVRDWEISVCLVIPFRAPL